MASAIAAGSAYSTQGEPMIPVYMFYSMFGFQRTADSIWAMADQLARGFLIGATAGRTTLTGEGLQHADGHSPLIAQTNPAVVHYDPAYGFEISHIVKDGLARMYGSTDEFPHGEDVIYYLTVYNEPIIQPVEPDDLDVEGVLKGAYLFRTAERRIDHRAHPGVRRRRAVGAQGTGDPRRAATTSPPTSGRSRRGTSSPATPSRPSSGTSTTPASTPRVPWISRSSRTEPSVTVAVSDYMRAVPDQIARWVPGPWQSLGTDGFGFADTRAAARRVFQVDAESIVVGVLQTLAQQSKVDPAVVREAFTTCGSTTPRPSRAWLRRAPTPEPTVSRRRPEGDRPHIGL